MYTLKTYLFLKGQEVFYRRTELERVNFAEVGETWPITAVAIMQAKKDIAYCRLCVYDSYQTKIAEMIIYQPFQREIEK